MDLSIGLLMVASLVLLSLLVMIVCADGKKVLARIKQQQEGQRSPQSRSQEAVGIP